VHFWRHLWTSTPVMIVWLGLAPLASAVEVADSKAVVLLLDKMRAGDLAAPASGQTVYAIDVEQHTIVALDPFEPGKRWTAISHTSENPTDKDRPAEKAAIPIAIGCVDSGTLAIVYRSGDEWFLRTQRLSPPGRTADPAPQQTIALGTATGSAEGVRVAVSHSRNWLVVTGLPEPLPAVVRVPIAGSRLGAVTTRNCPRPLPPLRPSAATVSGTDELVLFMTPPAAELAQSIFVSFYSPLNSLPLLRIETGLESIRDAAFCRSNDTLWVIAGEPGSQTCPEGIWRLDATIEHARQAVRATCVAQIAAAQSLVCLSDKAIIVACAGARPQIVRIDQTPPVLRTPNVLP